MTTMTELAPLRTLIAAACRVLAGRGLADGILGHISLRIDEHLLLVRCRGPRERGLGYTTGEDIRLVDLDGQAGASGELDNGYSVPNELPLHTEVLRVRSDINVVVHAHPPDVVAADLAGIAIRPIVGAFDIPRHPTGRRRSPRLSAQCSGPHPGAGRRNGRRDDR
jgi:3,4-dihydroxyphthalate decarboxylase